MKSINEHNTGRFIAFWGRHYEEKGGMYDMVGEFKTAELAIEYIENKHTLDDDHFAHIYDKKTGLTKDYYQEDAKNLWDIWR